MCCLSSSTCRPAGFLSWLASWLTFPLCPVVSAPLALFSMVRSVRSGSAWAMTRSTLFSPFIIVTMCVTAGAVRDYKRGQAVLHPQTCVGICGRPSFDPNWSIDARTRLPIESRMPRNGASRFMWRINDRVVRVLSRALGPQKGSYTGALPSRKAAGEALGRGGVASMNDLRLVPDVACYVGNGPARTDRPRSVTSMMIAATPFLGDRLLRKTEIDGLTLIGTGPDFFVVIDPATNREVARYGDPSR